MASSKSLIKSLLFRFVLFIFTLLTGAYIFVYLEKRPDVVKYKARENLEMINSSLVSNHNMSVEQLLEISESIKEQKNDLQELTFFYSIYMCSTIAFTTGSGHVVPTTDASKIFFIFYSIVSIAVSTLTLMCMGEIVQQFLRKFISFVENCIHPERAYQRRKYLHLKSLIMAVVLLLTFIVANCVLLSRFEYELLDAVYFIIQTWTTVGFGDIPVSESIHRYSKKGFLALFLPWTMIGLSLVAAVINGLVKLQSVPIAASIKKRIRSRNSERKNTSVRGDGLKDGTNKNKVMLTSSTGSVALVSYR